MNTFVHSKSADTAIVNLFVNHGVINLSVLSSLIVHIINS